MNDRRLNPHDRGNDRRDSFEGLLELAADVVLLTDPAGAVTWAGRHTPGKVGLGPAELLSKDWKLAVDGEYTQLATAAFEAANRQPGHPVTVELRLRAPGTSSRWYSVAVTDVSAQHEAAGCLVVATDVDERHLREDQLLFHAFRDSLTGLANRAVVEDRAALALARSARSKDETVLAYIDLDDFKQVNDALGHRAGDDVLRATAARLLEVVRPSDTVARFGGDEFVVLVEGVEGVDEAQTVGQRLLGATAVAIMIEGQSVTVTASIGVATGSHRSVEELLRQADAALYEAKARGKNRCVVALSSPGPSLSAEQP